MTIQKKPGRFVRAAKGGRFSLYSERVEPMMPLLASLKADQELCIGLMRLPELKVARPICRNTENQLY